MYLLKIKYLGTIRCNKLEIPEEFLKKSKRAIGYSIFAFKDHLSLVSYVPTKTNLSFLFFQNITMKRLMIINKNLP
jgi:hypothetical protein